jgi:hypothetical protein
MDKNTMLVFIAQGVTCALLEFFLGKTDKVKSNSILELILNGLTKMLKAIFKRE